MTQETTSSPQRLTLEEVFEVADTCLRQHGASAEQSRAVAQTVSNAERDECYSHGLFRIPGYCASLASGKVSGDAIPEVIDRAPSVVIVDANNGFAPLALEAGTPLLISKARQQGIAIMAVVNNHHFAALWPEVERLTDAGLVGMAFVSSLSYVAPAGGIKPLYGTNPMAFGWPRENGEAVIFDQASSASARGEIQIHQRDGKPLPDGWAIDSEGKPTTDPAAALAGAQLPFGGYKGAAIAMMVELLAGALIGDVFSFEASQRNLNDGGPPKGGETLIAIDPSLTSRATGELAPVAHAEKLFSELLAQPNTRLPSGRRYVARKRTSTDGVKVNAGLFATLEGLRSGSSKDG